MAWSFVNSAEVEMLFLASAGRGLAMLIEEGHPDEWVLLGAAVVLGWVVMPTLIRRGRPALACLLASVLFSAGCGVEAWRGRPVTTIAVCGLFSAGWLVAAAVIRRRSSRKVAAADAPDLARGSHSEDS